MKTWDVLIAIVRSDVDAGYKKGSSNDTLVFLSFVHANSISIFHRLGLGHLRMKRNAAGNTTPFSKCSASVNSLH